MMCLWQRMLPLMLAILSFASAKPATEDSLVVSRTENESSTIPFPSSEVTTEEPNAPVKLTDMEVQSEISMRYAHTAVVTRVHNPARRAQETTFRVLLPSTAFISGFIMTINGTSYKAYVKEKAEARNIYSEAVSQGFGAAHIAAKARDSNHFTVTVNVEPSSTVTFNLTYEELLVRRNRVYNHNINLHPGTLVPNMKVTVHIKESAKISVLRVPEVRTGNEIDAMEDDPQNTHAVIEKSSNDREATITFTPDINEQIRLVQVYAEKSTQSEGNRVRYYYPRDDEEKKDKDGILGQFVVQYDVDRPENGEVLVNDGYFVHFYAPKTLPPLPKHVVFVLDTSSSMAGRKISQLRDAMTSILNHLNPNDYFNIVEFNSVVKVLDVTKSDEYTRNPWRRHYYDHPRVIKLEVPLQASPNNIAKAKDVVSRLDARGATDILSALEVAIDLIHTGIASEPDANQSESNGASENKTTALSDNMNKVELQPIIIFLTDGDPTVGETDPTRIINRLSEKNFGEQKASIFSLAFGGDADRKFLRKLSLRNDGFMRHIYEAADAALQLQDFYRSVSSPLLADVTFLYPKAQIMEGTLTRNTFRTYYGGSEMVVAGRLSEPVVTNIQPHVLAYSSTEHGIGRTRFDISPILPVVDNNNNIYPLERLWAYMTIKQLLDQKDAIELSSDRDTEHKKELEKKALDIALKYEMVTPLTSLVVVKPNDTSAVDAESVDDNHQNELRSGGITYLRSGATAYARKGSRPHLHNLHFNRRVPAYSSYQLPSDRSAMSLYPRYGISAPSRGQHFRFRSASDRIMSGNYDSSHSSSPPGWLTSYLEQQTTTRSPLEPYFLKEFPWTLPLLDATSDSLLLTVNGTQINLKLIKDNTTPPASSEAGTACDNAGGGVPGHCVYLTQCAAAKSLSATTYESAYCVYDRGYAGVCCPELKNET